MKTKLLFFAAVAGCLAVSCNRSPSPSPQASVPLAQDVLAAVEDQTIRLADYEAELERRARGRSGSFARTDEREALLQEMVNFESAYLRAKEVGFDQKPEIARQIKAFIVERFMEEQFKDQPESPAISDVEIETYYRNHASHFATPEKVRFAVIQLGFSPKAAPEKKLDVLRKAESVLAEARTLNVSERAFGALAHRYSEDQATRYLGGDTGWVSREVPSRWDNAVVAAAFALAQSGNLSPVVKTSTGCYLVKLIERQSAGHRPLEEVSDAIRYQLAVEKRHRTQQEIHEAMAAGLKIEINRPLLEAMPTTASSQPETPPALPGS